MRGQAEQVKWTRSAKAFWSFVDRAVRDIRENGHQGRPSPMSFDDQWDDEFAQAYEDLRTFLKQFNSPRFYLVPPGLMFCPSPILAETAHQALMFLLNPSSQLYGERGILDSAEFKAIKAAAMQELKLVQETKEISIRRSFQSSKRNRKRREPSDLSDRAAELLSLLVADHRIDFEKPKYDVIGTQQEIAERLSNGDRKWNQGDVSKAVNLLFDLQHLNHLKPMDRYKWLCEQKQIVACLRRLDNPLARDAMRRARNRVNVDQFVDQFSDKGYEPGA